MWPQYGHHRFLVVVYVVLVVLMFCHRFLVVVVVVALVVGIVSTQNLDSQKLSLSLASVWT